VYFIKALPCHNRLSWLLCGKSLPFSAEFGKPRTLEESDVPWCRFEAGGFRRARRA
jgi:hypothetical protein